MLLQRPNILNFDATTNMDHTVTMQLIRSNPSALSVIRSRAVGSNQDVCQLFGKFRLIANGSGLRSMNRVVHQVRVTRRHGAWERIQEGFVNSRKTTTCNVMAPEQEIQGQGQGQTLASEDSSFVGPSGDRHAQSLAPDATQNHYVSTVTLPQILPRSLQIAQLPVMDQAVLVVGLIACTASFSLLAFVVTVIPTLHAMRKAANSVEKLADIAREELPGTMAAIRLSGMEISDLTLELNDLSQEISDGVKNSARAVHAAETGIRQLGALAASQTFAMLQGTASVPVQVVRPAVVSAAATTLNAVSQAQKLVLNLASSSYPHISGWLGQRKLSGKQRKSVAKILSSASYSELLTNNGKSGSSKLPDKSGIA